MMEYWQLKRIARHLCIPVKQNHAIVYRDGRFYFRRCAKMPSKGKWHIKSYTWSARGALRLTVAPVLPGCKVGIPLTPSRIGTYSLNFRSMKMAARFLRSTPQTDSMRVRITGRTRSAPTGEFRLSLSPFPVRDMYSIWQNMTTTTSNSDNLAPNQCHSEHSEDVLMRAFARII